MNTSDAIYEAHQAFLLSLVESKMREEGVSGGAISDRPFWFELKLLMGVAMSQEWSAIEKSSELFSAPSVTNEIMRCFERFISDPQIRFWLKTALSTNSFSGVRWALSTVLDIQLVHVRIDCPKPKPVTATMWRNALSSQIKNGVQHRRPTIYLLDVSYGAKSGNNLLGSIRTASANYLLTPELDG
jgi:hypothetical protein